MAARPHPGAALRRSRNREDAADHDAVLQHVAVVLVVADRRALGISGGIGAARPSSPTARGCIGGTAAVPPTDIPSGLIPRDAGMEDAGACCLDQGLIFGPTDVAQSLVRTHRNGKL